VQVSDSDRAAARELYIEGVKLQDQSKFDGALERFQRAQSVFSAPTHLLHIAECQAALGHLVESAETYRTLVRTPLPQGSPHAFVQAQQQGGAELTQVEPRIPALKIQVKPDNIQNLSVQIDGQTMSAALVGVARPINPGEHTVAVFAPGYGKSEQKIAIKEKEQKELPITLQPTSGVVYGPALSPLPAPSTPSASTYQAQTPQPTQTGPQGATQQGMGQQPQPLPDQPAVYQAPVERKHGAPTSFLFGPHVGLQLPGGNLTGAPKDKFSDLASSGGAFGIDAGIRFGRIFYGGAVFDHGIYGKGDQASQLAGSTPQGENLVVTTSSNYFGLTFALMTNPEGVGFYGDVGLGYRWMSFTYRNELTSNTSTFVENSLTARGTEGTLGIGMHFRLADAFRLIPKISASFGSFSKEDLSCSSGGAGSCNGIRTFDSQDIQQTDTHSFVFVGVVGFFDIGQHGPQQ
jgi:hypothetical protein